MVLEHNETNWSELMSNRPTSYALHIRPLFSKGHSDCMSYIFELDRYDDVRDNAELIYERLADKSMPMDETGPWPDEWVTLFRRWIDEGRAA
jgi:hypothetical protein